MRLHRLLIVAGFVALSGIYGAAPAAAQPEPILSWDDCRLGGGATNKNDPCDSNTGVNKLIVSLEPNGSIPQVNGVQGVLDVSFTGTVPDFWHLQNGGARQGHIVGDAMVGESNAPFSCGNPWAAVGNQAGAVSFTLYPGGLPNFGRILFIAAIPGVTTLSGGEQYLIAVNLLRGGSTTVPGCATPACLSLLSIRITRPAETPGGDVWACPGTRSHVTWQGGVSPCPNALDPGPRLNPCSPTPGSRSTWGSIKGLYR